ncbi:MAG: NUDIX hydrolase [Planctomycetota bacterium]
MENKEPDILHRGRFLELRSINTWEYVHRHNATGIAAIIPLHTDQRFVFIEQYRPAVDAPVIDWPAGLAGDEGEAESMLNAAKRELLEETGYEASSWTPLGQTLSSPGLTDESVDFFLAEELTQVGPGGGVEGEGITCHEVPADELNQWITTMRRAGKRFDVKVYAGLGMLRMI